MIKSVMPKPGFADMTLNIEGFLNSDRWGATDALIYATSPFILITLTVSLIIALFVLKKTASERIALRWMVVGYVIVSTAEVIEQARLLVVRLAVNRIIDVDPVPFYSSELIAIIKIGLIFGAFLHALVLWVIMTGRGFACVRNIMTYFALSFAVTYPLVAYVLFRMGM